MREHDEVAVPVLRHDDEEIGPRLMLGCVAGRDCGNRFGARRGVGKRGPGRVLGPGQAPQIDDVRGMSALPLIAAQC